MQAGSNLNFLCVWHLDASPPSKNHEKLQKLKNWSDKLRKHIWMGYLAVLLPFWSSKVFFLIWCPFHSFIYSFNFLLLAGSQGNLLHWHIVMMCLKLPSVNSYDVHGASTMSKQLLYYFQLNKWYIFIDTLISGFFYFDAHVNRHHQLSAVNPIVLSSVVWLKLSAKKF